MVYKREVIPMHIMGTNTFELLSGL